MCVCGVGLVFAPLVMITVKWLSSKINKGGSTDEQREMLSCHTPFRNYYQVRLDWLLRNGIYRSGNLRSTTIDPFECRWIHFNIIAYTASGYIFVHSTQQTKEYETNIHCWFQSIHLIFDSPLSYARKKKDNRKKTRWIYRPHNRPHCSQLRYHGMPKNMLTIFQLQINGLAHE